MEKHIFEIFTDETVVLDGKSFVSCVFDNCILEFHGTAACRLVSNQILRSRFSLSGRMPLNFALLRGLQRNLKPEQNAVVQEILSGYLTEYLENFAGPVYKYLPEEFALSMVEKGEVRINTLWNFQATETYGEEIGDKREGVVESILIKDYDPDRDRAPLPDLANFGISLGGGSLENCLIEFSPRRVGLIRNYYIYCVSKSFDPGLYERFGNEYDTCVEIVDPRRFFIILISELLSRIHNARVASCQYGPKQATYNREIEEHPACIKDAKYSYQSEARLFCKPIEDSIEAFNIINPEITTVCRISARKRSDS